MFSTDFGGNVLQLSHNFKQLHASFIMLYGATDSDRFYSSLACYYIPEFRVAWQTLVLLEVISTFLCTNYIQSFKILTWKKLLARRSNSPLIINISKRL